MLSCFSDDRRCNFGGADFHQSPVYKYQKNCIQGSLNVYLHGLTGIPPKRDITWQHFPTYRTFGNESWKVPARRSQTWQRTSRPVDHYISQQQTTKDYRSVRPSRSRSSYRPFAYHRSNTPREIPRHSGYSGWKNVLRKLLRIPYRRLKAAFLCVDDVLTVFVCCWSSEGNAQSANVCSLKAFLFEMFAFFSSLENYFGFRTTNAKGKTDHSVSLKWNKRFWTFLKRRVFFWLCIRLIYELISLGWIKTRLYSVISSYGYFSYMPRFITFTEPALSLSSVKEPYCCYNASEWTNLCAY